MLKITTVHIHHCMRATYVGQMSTIYIIISTKVKGAWVRTIKFLSVITGILCTIILSKRTHRNKYVSQFHVTSISLFLVYDVADFPKYFSQKRYAVDIWLFSQILCITSEDSQSTQCSLCNMNRAACISNDKNHYLY